MDKKEPEPPSRRQILRRLLLLMCGPCKPLLVTRLLRDAMLYETGCVSKACANHLFVLAARAIDPLTGRTLDDSLVAMLAPSPWTKKLASDQQPWAVQLHRLWLCRELMLRLWE